MPNFGGGAVANELLIELTQGLDFKIPDVDLDDPIFDFPGGIDSPLYQQLKALKNSDLTSGTVGGDGTFDVLMTGLSAHLKTQYEEDRITGSEYARAFVELTAAAMGNAVQFLLGRDQAFWAAQLAQVQAITARVQLQTAKVELARIQFQALTAESEYALTKLRLAGEDASFAQTKFNVDNILPNQNELLELQQSGQSIQNNTGTYTLQTMLPQQFLLLSEQTEVQRAQTLNTRSDTLAVQGTLGKQRDLYDQQITSYKRDAEVKAAKFFSDAWITQKTIDEGTLPPTNFTNVVIDEVMSTLKTNNNL